MPILPLAIRVPSIGAAPFYPADDEIVTHHDTVTNFAKDATILSVADGDWSDPGTWDENRVPEAGDIVGVQRNTTVIYDVSSTAAILAVGIAGTLRFQTDINTKLTVQNLILYGPPTLGAGQYGYLEIGTAATPVNAANTAEVVFSDAALLDLNTGGVTNKEYSNGFQCYGKARIHGTAKSDWVECTANLAASATTLNFQEAVSGWAVGDRIVIPDTRAASVNVVFDNIEVRTVSTIAGDGLSLTLPALTYAHPRAVDKDGNQDFAPEVANLTRNVIFRSENPDGVRGHTIFFDRCDCDISYARFAGLGRTKNQSLPNTTTNQKGRYPVHVHRIMGPGSGAQGAGGIGYDASRDPLELKPGDPLNTRSSNGPTFAFIGNVIEGTVTSSPDEKWLLTLHDTCDAYIKSNVLYRGTGALMMFEDGTEVYNIIERNFLVHTYNGTGDRGDEGFVTGAPGREGSGMSIPNLHNWFRTNRVYNVTTGSNGPLATAYHCYGGQSHADDNFVGSQEDVFAQVTIPLWQGADPEEDGEQRYTYPIIEFSNNECGSCEIGWTVWFLGTSYGARGPEEIDTSVLLNFSAWQARTGIFNYPNANLHIVGGKWRGFGEGAGWGGGDYMTRGFVIDGLDIQGFAAGIATPLTVGVRQNGHPYDSEGLVSIQNTILANTINVQSFSIFHVGDGAIQPARRVEFTNCTFHHPGGWSKDLDLEFMPDDTPGANFVVADSLYFFNHNGDTDDDFRIYWTQQAPDYITPQTNAGLQIVGSPEAGQTNTQNLSEHGVCVAGTIWSGTDTRTGFEGYVENV